MTPVAKESLEPGCAELLAENELDLDVQHLALSLSVATSAKRTADALSLIADVLDGKRGYGLNELVENVVGILGRLR